MATSSSQRPRRRRTGSAASATLIRIRTTPMSTSASSSAPTAASGSTKQELIAAILVSMECADSAERFGDYAAAVAYNETLLADDPDDQVYLLSLLRLYRELGRSQDA